MTTLQDKRLLEMTKAELLDVAKATLGVDTIAARATKAQIIEIIEAARFKASAEDLVACLDEEAAKETLQTIDQTDHYAPKPYPYQKKKRPKHTAEKKNRNRRRKIAYASRKANRGK